MTQKPLPFFHLPETRPQDRPAKRTR